MRTRAPERSAGVRIPQNYFPGSWTVPYATTMRMKIGEKEAGFSVTPEC